MEAKFRIDGIYDKRTFQLAQEEKVLDLVFDFRPRSFNFIQQHVMNEILEGCSGQVRIYLKFADEKEFIIQEILKSLPSNIESSQVFLEFSGNESWEFISQFEHCFYWKFNEDIPWKKIVDLPNIKGIILSDIYLNYLHDRGNIHSFINNTYQVLIGSGKLSLEWVLERDWDSDLFPSAMDLFDFNMVSLPINNKVEVCYRNVNLQSFKKLFSKLQADFTS